MVFDKGTQDSEDVDYWIRIAAECNCAKAVGCPEERILLLNHIEWVFMLRNAIRVWRAFVTCFRLQGGDFEPNM